MTLQGMAVPGFPDGTPGTVWMRLVLAGMAVACAGAAAWLLGAKHPASYRAQLLFGPGAAAERGPQARARRPAPGAAATAGAGGGGHRAPGMTGPPGDRRGPRVGRLGKRRPMEGWSPAGGGPPGAGCGGRAAGAVGYRIGARTPLRGLAPPWSRVGGLLHRVGRQAASCLVAGTFLAVLGDSVLPLLLALAALPAVWRAAKAREARQERSRRADAVITLCGALAGEVRAGRHAGEALLTAARDSDGLAAAQAAVLAAARFGGDVPRALSGAAREPGADGLLGVAACWRVAVDSGAGLAAGLERLEATLRAERDQRAELHAQLAGARSTAVLLAGLPVLGLVLGAALGADPLHVLLHSGAGLGCLLVGGVLESAGLWWALRIVRNGEDA